MSKVKIVLSVAVIATFGLIGYILVMGRVGADTNNGTNEELSIGNFKDISKDILSNYSISPDASFAFMQPLIVADSHNLSSSSPIAFVTELYHYHDNTTTKYSPYVFRYINGQIKLLAKFPNLSENEAFVSFDNIAYMNIPDNSSTNDAVYLSSSMNPNNFYKVREDGVTENLMDRFTKGKFNVQGLMSTGKYIIPVGFDNDKGNFHLVLYDPFFNSIDDQTGSISISLGASKPYYDKKIVASSWNGNAYMASSDQYHYSSYDYGLVAIKYSNASKLSLLRLRHDYTGADIGSMDITKDFQQISGNTSGIIDKQFDVKNMAYNSSLNKILINTGESFYTYDGTKFEKYNTGINKGKNIFGAITELYGTTGWFISINSPDGQYGSFLYKTDSTVTTDLTTQIIYGKNLSDQSLLSTGNVMAAYYPSFDNPKKGYGLVAGRSASLLNSFEIYPTTHDLSVTTFSATPNPVKRGGLVSFNTTIKNTGTVTETNVVVKYSDQNGKNISTLQTIPVINPGEEKTIASKPNKQISYKPGTFTINTKVSPVAGEQNTQDNSKSTQVVVTR